VETAIADYRLPLISDVDKMRFVIELSRLNVEHRTGGPFAAAVFDRRVGELVAPGVNVVLGGRCSVAHAEIMALAIAQRLVGSHDLAADDVSAHELVTSTEPCAMCLGAIPWSGVGRVVCGARDEDARSAGFDEGPKLDDWVGALGCRGIHVHRDICRESARSVLLRYRHEGGAVYNSRISDTDAS